jgi:hypothetical protein
VVGQAVPPANQATVQFARWGDNARILGLVPKTILALLLAQLLAADAPPPELLGRWRSLETSSGGLGMMLRFRPNGVVDFSPGAVVEMTYRIEGGEIVFPPGTTKGLEQRQKMEFISTDRLRLAEARFTRSGAAPDAKNPILGEWVGKRDMDGHPVDAWFFFYSAGKCLLLMPFETSPGQYSVQSSTMRLELPGHKVAEGKFQIEGDVLTAPSQNGSARFRRY